jgi:taurine dioxygenase
MMDLNIQRLSQHIPFGVRISGINSINVHEEGVCDRIRDIFDSAGLIVFEDMEPSNQMQALVSEMFGTRQGHRPGAPVPDGEGVAGFVELEHGDICELDGEEVMSFLPWHFDQCYNKILTRGGVLRALEIVPEGGLTGFADGIQIYNAIDPVLRKEFESHNILYQSSLIFWHMKFGRPRSYSSIKARQMVINQIPLAKARRSIHPAIWQRETGEKVLHVSPMQAAGIEGMENPEGNALLEALCQEMYKTMTPYYHEWRPTDMVIWDNCRFIHSVTGHSPKWHRKMRRTIVYGDYGLGRFEHESATAS